MHIQLNSSNYDVTAGEVTDQHMRKDAAGHCRPTAEYVSKPLKLTRAYLFSLLRAIKGQTSMLKKMAAVPHINIDVWLLHRDGVLYV